jgi:pSer/pThr/pTyr-binding forkhead associated (FHA) protein
MWILETIGDAPERPLKFRLRPGDVKTIGRTRRADIVVEAPLVSRLHCRLEAADEAIAVVDLKSTNGTFVNGKRVTRAAVRSGDRLTIGRVELTIASAREGAN